MVQHLQVDLRVLVAGEADVAQLARLARRQQRLDRAAGGEDTFRVLGADDLVDTQKRLLALRAIRKSKNFEPLAISFKRIRKILEKAGVAPGGDGRVNPELFESPAERELHSGATAAATKVQTLKRGGKYQEALEVIAGLRPVVDRFFDGVMVMADREEVRKNRLALLANLLGEFTTIADFSEIGGEERAGAS